MHICNQSHIAKLIRLSQIPLRIVMNLKIHFLFKAFDIGAKYFTSSCFISFLWRFQTRFHFCKWWNYFGLFRTFFGNVLLQIIVKETNRYARQYINSAVHKERSSWKKWSDNEMNKKKLHPFYFSKEL